MAIVIFNRKVVNQLRKYTRILYMEEVMFLKFVTVDCWKSIEN